ncbi:hypothetical protein BJ978_002294 [Agromyces terreus]|uniref:Uncharacterized protein n=1 Tax=Agromyces terreus TaxID=424795 RepID=A0A9X2KBQ5_9MICO|nr:hypothetical protein [Agromyces terreus]
MSAIGFVAAARVTRVSVVRNRRRGERRMSATPAKA